MAPKTPADHDAQARAGGGGGTGSLAARHGIRVLSQRASRTSTDVAAALRQQLAVVKKCRNADAESPEQHRIRELQTKNAQLKEDSQVWMTALRYSKISRDILEARMEVLKRELKEEKAKVEEVRKQWSGMAGVLGEKVNDKRA